MPVDESQPPELTMQTLSPILHVVSNIPNVREELNLLTSLSSGENNVDETKSKRLPNAYSIALVRILISPM